MVKVEGEKVDRWVRVVEDVVGEDVNGGWRGGKVRSVGVEGLGCMEGVVEEGVKGEDGDR